MFNKVTGALSLGGTPKRTSTSDIKPKKTGWLLAKKSSGLTGGFTNDWKKKFVVLTSSALQIKADRNFESPVQDTFSLRDAQLESAPSSKHQKEHCFEVIARGKILVLSASTADVAREWQEAIRIVINKNSAKSTTGRERASTAGGPGPDRTKTPVPVTPIAGGGGGSGGTETPLAEQPTNRTKRSNSGGSEVSHRSISSMARRTPIQPDPFSDTISDTVSDFDRASVAGSVITTPMTSPPTNNERKLLETLDNYRDEIAKLKLQLQGLSAAPREEDVQRIYDRIRDGKYQAVYECRSLSSKVEILRLVLQEMIVEEELISEEEASLWNRKGTPHSPTGRRDSFATTRRNGGGGDGDIDELSESGDADDDDDYQSARISIATSGRRGSNDSTSGRNSRNGSPRESDRNNKRGGKNTGSSGSLLNRFGLDKMKKSYAGMKAKMGLTDDGSSLPNSSSSETLDHRDEDRGERTVGRTGSGVLHSVKRVSGAVAGASGAMLGAVGLKGKQRRKEKATLRIGLGNSEHILVVLLFLLETLSFDVFFSLLKEYPWALTMLIAHMEREGTTPDILMKLYEAQGKYKEVIFIRVKLAYQQKKPKEKLLRLKELQLILENYDEKKIDCHFERKQIGDHVKLLERQFQIEQIDFGEGEQKEKEPQVAAKEKREGADGLLHTFVTRPLMATAEVTGKVVQKTLDVTKDVAGATVNVMTTGSFEKEKRLHPNLLDLPVVRTLAYCLFYHEIQEKTDPRHPRVIQALFNISERRYVIFALKAKARKGDWNGIKNLIPVTTPVKGLGDSYWKSRLGLEPFLEIYRDNDGPLENLDYFAELITDERDRYDVCLKFELYEVGVKTAQTLREPELYIELAQHIYKTVGVTDRSRRLRQVIDDRIAMYVKDSKSILSFDEGSSKTQAQEIADAWQKCDLCHIE